MKNPKNESGIIANLSSYREKVIPKDSFKNKTFSPDLNEYGELAVEKKNPRNTTKIAWHYRFFISMVIFLLIMILLNNMISM